MKKNLFYEKSQLENYFMVLIKYDNHIESVCPNFGQLVNFSKQNFGSSDSFRELSPAVSCNDVL